MSDEWLTPSEVKALVGPGDAQAQAERLQGIGIPCKVVRKRPIASREHARQWLLGVQLRPSVGPRLDLVR